MRHFDVTCLWICQTEICVARRSWGRGLSWGFCQPRPRPARSATRATNFESQPLFKPSVTRAQTAFIFHLHGKGTTSYFQEEQKKITSGESPPYWPTTLKYNHRYRHRYYGLRSCTRNRLHPKLQRLKTLKTMR